MQLDQLRLSDYKGFTSFPAEVLEAARSVEYSPVRTSSHSITSGIDFKDQSGTVVHTFFGKQYFHPSGSDEYTASHHPAMLWAREWQNTDRISKFIKGGNRLVAPVVGYSAPENVLLFEYLTKSTEREKFLKAQDNENDKRELLFKAARHTIARFDGKIRAQNHRFSEHLKEVETAYRAVRRIEDYLLTIIDFNTAASTGEKLPEEREEKLLALSRKYKGLDLNVELMNIVQQGILAFGDQTAIQHGDCRLHHVIGTRLLDLEDFGIHPFGYDLVTYLNAEGGISFPHFDDLKKVLVNFLAFERAYANPNATQRIKSIDLLKAKDPGEVEDIIAPLDHLNFLAHFMNLDLIENLRLDASNKRSSQERRNSFRTGIKDYTEEKMLKARQEHIVEAFKFIGEGYGSGAHMPKDENVREYFYSWGELLERLELIPQQNGLLTAIRGKRRAPRK